VLRAKPNSPTAAGMPGSVLFRKLSAGGRAHRSRFHDEKGNRLDLAGFRYLPHCLVTTSLRVTTGRRPAVPWIGYRGLARIESLLRPTSRVLEFGSGMSTVWFAARCREVVSIENCPDWYATVQQLLRRRCIGNVDYRLASAEDYSRLDDLPDRLFDFILIDGIRRGACARAALRKLTPGGSIYLDNSDKYADTRDGDTRIAERTLLKATADAGDVEYFVDLVPTYLAVTQGMLVRPKDTTGTE